MKRIHKNSLILLLLVFTACAAFKFSEKPTLFIIGDSTVKNGHDKGDLEQWGWGHFLPDSFDTTRIHIENHALGGTSTKTFITKGLWAEVLKKMKPGDYVIMQFGHNDSSPLDDTARARGTLKSNAEDSVEIYNPILKKKEIVHSYGWYLRKFVAETKAKGGTAIICSLIPRDAWTNGEIRREGYVDWAKAAAEQSGAYFIDLNAMIREDYKAEGLDEESLRKKYFTIHDHTHTNRDGAILNAQFVAKGIKDTKGLDLKKYLK